MIAFLHYRDNAVDYAVIECGLGGRHDATNILERVSCAAITSIGNDHAEIIGPELSDIAYEKAGIIKKATKQIVLGPTAKPFEIFAKTCEISGSKLSVIEGYDESFYNINKRIAQSVIQNTLETDGHLTHLERLKNIKVNNDIELEQAFDVQMPCRLEKVVTPKLIE